MNHEQMPVKKETALPRLPDREKSGERVRTPAPLEAETLLFEMTPTEFRLLQEAPPEDRAIQDLLKRKRIRAGMGEIVIEVLGKRHLITTSKEDFGTEINRKN